MNTLLVIGGVHGDETLGVAVAQRVGGLLANPRAIKQKARYTETDLNRSFLVPTPVSYEERVAKKLEKIIRSGRYSCIIDIHTTKANQSTCAIITTTPNQLHMSLISYFGFNKIVIMPPSQALISVCPSISLALEVSENDHNYSVLYLVQKLKSLNTNPIMLTALNNTKQYRYVHRVHKKTVQRLRIPLKGFKNFVPLTKKQKNKLRLNNKTDYCPLFTKGATIADGSFTLLAKEKTGS